MFFVPANLANLRRRGMSLAVTSLEGSGPEMQEQRFAGQFATIFQKAVALGQAVEADALLLLLDGPTEWTDLRGKADALKVIVAADTPDELIGAADAGL